MDPFNRTLRGVKENLLAGNLISDSNQGRKKTKSDAQQRNTSTKVCSGPSRFGSWEKTQVGSRFDKPTAASLAKTRPIRSNLVDGALYHNLKEKFHFLQVPETKNQRSSISYNMPVSQDEGKNVPMWITNSNEVNETNYFMKPSSRAFPATNLEESSLNYRNTKTRSENIGSKTKLQQFEFEVRGARFLLPEKSPLKSHTKHISTQKKSPPKRTGMVEKKPYPNNICNPNSPKSYHFPSRYKSIGETSTYGSKRTTPTDLKCEKIDIAKSLCLNLKRISPYTSEEDIRTYVVQPGDIAPNFFLTNGSEYSNEKPSYPDIINSPNIKYNDEQHSLDDQNYPVKGVRKFKKRQKHFKEVVPCSSTESLEFTTHPPTRRRRPRKSKDSDGQSCRTASNTSNKRSQDFPKLATEDPSIQAIAQLVPNDENVCRRKNDFCKPLASKTDNFDDLRNLEKIEEFTINETHAESAEVSFNTMITFNHNIPVEKSRKTQSIINWLDSTSLEKKEHVLKALQPDEQMILSKLSLDEEKSDLSIEGSETDQVIFYGISKVREPQRYVQVQNVNGDDLKGFIDVEDFRSYTPIEKQPHDHGKVIEITLDLVPNTKRDLNPESDPHSMANHTEAIEAPNGEIEFENVEVKNHTTCEIAQTSTRKKIVRFLTEQNQLQGEGELITNQNVKPNALLASALKSKSVKEKTKTVAVPTKQRYMVRNQDKKTCHERVNTNVTFASRKQNDRDPKSENEKAKAISVLTEQKDKNSNKDAKAFRSRVNNTSTIAGRKPNTKDMKLTPKTSTKTPATVPGNKLQLTTTNTRSSSTSKVPPKPRKVSTAGQQHAKPRTTETISDVKRTSVKKSSTNSRKKDFKSKTSSTNDRTKSQIHHKPLLKKKTNEEVEKHLSFGQKLTIKSTGTNVHTKTSTKVSTLRKNRTSSLVPAKRPIGPKDIPKPSCSENAAGTKPKPNIQPDTTSDGNISYLSDLKSDTLDNGIPKKKWIPKSILKKEEVIKKTLLEALPPVNETTDSTSRTMSSEMMSITLQDSKMAAGVTKFPAKRKKVVMRKKKRVVKRKKKTFEGTEMPPKPTKKKTKKQVAQRQRIISFRKQFELFAKFGDRRNSGRTITMVNSVRWLRQASIIDSRMVTMNDVEIFFIHTTQRRRSLTMKEFLIFLKTLSVQKRLNLAVVVTKLIECGEPVISATDLTLEEMLAYDSEGETTVNQFANHTNEYQVPYRSSTRMNREIPFPIPKAYFQSSNEFIPSSNKPFVHTSNLKDESPPSVTNEGTIDAIVQRPCTHAKEEPLPLRKTNQTVFKRFSSSCLPTSSSGRAQEITPSTSQRSCSKNSGGEMVQTKTKLGIMKLSKPPDIKKFSKAVVQSSTKESAHSVAMPTPLKNTILHSEYRTSGNSKLYKKPKRKVTRKNAVETIIQGVLASSASE